ncbi:hypothetical protein SCA03_58660 [Streptomyces cacaoi]|uniref:Uncharacterized protein n=1 Tax=Streptomyces cacaoi TaxID=1898 RepID=A0A4Y3R6I5_STRCI|nr:hypothetical protein SCA03_58660 [Streptomyces cacaoi]
MRAADFRVGPQQARRALPPRGTAGLVVPGLVPRNVPGVRFPRAAREFRQGGRGPRVHRVRQVPPAILRGRGGECSVVSLPACAGTPESRHASGRCEACDNDIDGPHRSWHAHVP